MPASGKHNPSHEPVDSGDLKIGMFVTELDRPWLGTPFLLQGFLIEEAGQIASLQQYCKLVYVDRRRSVGDQHAASSRGRYASKSPRTASLLKNNRGSAEEAAFSSLAMMDENDFLSVVHRIRIVAPGSNVPREPPPARGSSLEAELLYSAPIIDDVHRTLEALRNGVDSKGNVDLTRARGLVEEMAAGVERNPDAMLWLTRLKITDQYSYDHAVDVAVHLMVFGRFLALGGHTIEELGQAGLMQDVGKVQLDPEILAKPSALTEEEFRQVQTHVLSSLELLSGQKTFSNAVLSIVAAHHERYDGSGYPSGLRGDNLGLHAELAGLIDTYCAMTRHRVFSPAISSQKALEVLSRMRGIQFREALVDQFVQCIGLYPIGTLVELNTGEVAVVIQQNQVRRLKPRVLILLAQDKKLERRPRSLDLILDPATPTGEVYRIKHALPTNAYGINPSEFFLD